MGPLLPGPRSCGPCGPIVTPLGNVLFISMVGTPGPSWLVPPDPPVTVPGLREGQEAEGRGIYRTPISTVRQGARVPCNAQAFANNNCSGPSAFFFSLFFSFLFFLFSFFLSFSFGPFRTPTLSGLPALQGLQGR